MERGDMASSTLRLGGARRVPLALALLLTMAGHRADAQTLVGDNNNRPAVTVDWGVLDELGPPRTLPDLLRGNPPQRQETLPGTSRSTAETGIHAPKPKKTAAKQKEKRDAVPKVAARRAAPIAPVAAAQSGAPAPRESVTATALAEPPAQPSPAPAPSEPAPPAPAAKPAPPAAPAGVPSAAQPGPVPTAEPSAAAVTAMNTPPAITPQAPAIAAPVAPAAIAPAAGGSTRLLFAAGTSDLPEAAKVDLDALVQRLNGNERLRLQLVAYAAGPPQEANQARRVSLQRALAVRSYLMEHGINNSRMDVRALGNRAEDKDAPDRVDIVMLDR
jgi:outer membrane protein OmpA-like peptidoglycan-associated protein